MIEYHSSNGIAWITLNRPDKRNALSRALIASLHDAFTNATNDDTIRVIILTGNGSAFCAGMDLEELHSTITAESDIIWDDARKLSQLYQRIYECAKPTIAAVNGTAVAGGAGLVTVCDLAVSVPSAKFGYPEVRRGLVAAMVMPHLLRHVGERMGPLAIVDRRIDRCDRRGACRPHQSHRRSGYIAFECRNVGKIVDRGRPASLGNDEVVAPTLFQASIVGAGVGRRECRATIDHGVSTGVDRVL